MRVIAGRFRGRNLVTPKGLATRPTTDRIKETIFNILQNHVPGSNFLDLYAGSGQIGIEALSRGAKHVWLVDSSRDAKSAIESNMNTLKIQEECTFLNRDCLSAIASFPSDMTFDLVFMDPPYKDEKEYEILKSLLAKNCLHENSLIVIEADLHRDFSFVKGLGYQIERIKKYKTNQHIFLSLKKN